MQKRKTSSAPSSILGQNPPVIVVLPPAAKSGSSTMYKQSSKTKFHRVLAWVLFAVLLALFQMTTFRGHVHDILFTQKDKNWASSSNYKAVVSSLRQRGQGPRRHKKRSVFTPAEATEISNPIQQENERKMRRKSVFTPMMKADELQEQPKRKKTKSVFTPMRATEAQKPPKPVPPVSTMKKTRTKSLFTPFKANKNVDINQS